MLTNSMETEIANKNLLLARSLAGEVEKFLEEPLGLLRQVEHVIGHQLVQGEQINPYLSSVLTNYTFFETLMLLDADGSVRYLAPYDEDFRQIDMSGQPFFQFSSQHRQPYWSPTFISPQTGNPTLTVSLSIEQGILVGYLDLTILNDIIDKIKIASSGYAAIVDKDGTVIAHPNRNFVSQRLNVQELEMIQQGMQGYEGTFKYVFEKEERLGSIAIVPQTRWIVVVVQPIEEAHASIRQMRAILLAGLSSAILLAAFMALVSARKTTQPLSHLIGQTKQIAAGDYHVVPHERHYTEVDELTDDFNRMVQAIKTRETALRETEQEIRKLNATLEDRVARRTHELEAANKELKSFAYVVSHDLKAPLRGISRLAHWIVEDYADAIDEKGREMSAMLIGRVKRMDDLIEGILQYSRVGRIEAEYETLDLNELLHAIIDSLAPPEDLHIAIAGELPMIVGERIRIMQVFQNLLSNAIKFMDHADGHITIGGEEHDAFWKLWVADDGPGIDPKYHERIFQIFQTLRPRDEQENTGVGLAIVKKIIDLYGGEIWLESKAGEDCTFVFTLPKKTVS
jgi:signal transduction histidine kinase